MLSMTDLKLDADHWHDDDVDILTGILHLGINSDFDAHSLDGLKFVSNNQMKRSITSHLTWHEGFPKRDFGDDSCVVFSKGKMRNVECLRSHSDLKFGYICEARPIQIVQDKSTACVFPFEMSGKMHDSCVYQGENTATMLLDLTKL